MYTKLFCSSPRSMNKNFFFSMSAHTKVLLYTVWPFMGSGPFSLVIDTFRKYQQLTPSRRDQHCCTRFLSPCLYTIVKLFYQLKYGSTVWFNPQINPLRPVSGLDRPFPILWMCKHASTSLFIYSTLGFIGSQSKQKCFLHILLLCKCHNVEFFSSHLYHCMTRRARLMGS